MKSYLSLIPISARVHRRKNRMTILCIIFAVFMVTAVFSMAEMGIRMEQARLVSKHGSLSFWDIAGSAIGQSLMGTAAVLFLLILIAGVLMISGSINSSVAQRTRFFGMMRCIGMSRQQIIRFVRLEALNWCKTAVPAGIALGILVTWILCAVLRFFVGGEFSEIPLFGISLIGIVSGAAMGILTVLIAAGSPARRAAKVSPVTAVSGNAESTGRTRHPASARFFRIDTILGIRHAVSTGKNLILMTGSFALSIILFLSFLVMIDFVNCLMPQSAGAPDLEIAASDGMNSIPPRLAEMIGKMDGVQEVYGRRSEFGVEAELNGNTQLSGGIDLISYDDFDLACLKKDGILKRGSDLQKVYGNSGYVLATSDQDSLWKTGDTVQIGEETLEIAGLLKYDPFNGDGLTDGKLTLITSGETFVRLTKTSGYSLVMIQMENGASDAEAEAIREAVAVQKTWDTGEGFDFQDKRGESTEGTYLAFVFCVYGFLAVIVLVTVLNIVNSISMSASARIRQYGAMRAVGMDGRQVAKMIIAEAFTYALTGCAAGCTAGLLISRWLYGILITEHFRYAVWEVPVLPLLGIFLFVLAAAALAGWAPAKRIRGMSVTETINEL